MIEVIVVRHPDAGTDVTVLVDGVEVAYGPKGALVTVIDPGSGHSPSGWESAREEALIGSTTRARAVINSAYSSYAGSSFIETGWED